MSRYAKKQFTIFVVFLFIVIVIGLGIYFLIQPSAPTCFDGIQNQGEQGVDCGGPCGHCEKPEDLIILSQEFIPTIENNFDLVAKIENPNRDWGVESVDYEFILYGRNNQMISSKQGRTYLLPQQSKYIIEPKIYSSADLVEVELRLEEVNWQKLKDFEELEIKIRDKELKAIDQGVYKLVGNVENKSSYDLDKIEVMGLLFSDGEIVAVGKTEMRTILIDEVRYFEISWPYQFIQEISSFELKPYTNIYLNENFLKTHATPERFKEY